jgi:hypothetical protein
LLLAKSARVDVAVFVEGQNGERASEHAHWNSTSKLDDHVGHAHSLPREIRQTMVSRIPQHPVELRVRQAIDASVLSNEKSTER